ncbi:acyltransferase family protein, partial [uncultured Akkermansia sp.]|uniref:acyltransferase family protein n=1 Tax=uncultured Akkermansia sp. TaxID=512294 RepID=UPI00265C9E0D
MNELSSLAWSDRCGSVKPVKKFRDPWVDIIRVLAMLVIMFQHTPTSHAPLDYVTSSGVFFFFIAAGYFLGLKYERSPFPVPWLNWRKASLILSAYLFWIFISMLVFGFPSNLVDWVTNLGIGRFPVGVVLWFLRDLMVFVLISGILFRVPRS